jgi:hypothetical protein
MPTERSQSASSVSRGRLEIVRESKIITAKYTEADDETKPRALVIREVKHVSCGKRVAR